MSNPEPVATRIPKVAARTRLHETSEAIRRIILDGTLPSGSRAKDQELASALGVSRATVREAVRQLVHEGLLAHEPYRGLTVATLDDETFVHLADVRAALETLAAERASRVKDESVTVQLRAALDELAAARRTVDVSQINQAHIAFHRLIVTLSGNPILTQAWAVLEMRARLEMKIDLETRPGLDRFLRDHEATVDVIEEGIPARIAAHFAGHIVASAHDVIRARHAVRPGEETPAASI